LTKKSRAVLTGERNVFMFMSAVSEQEVANYNLELFNKLREVGMTLSKEFKVAPFVIFSDATLRDMARYLPETKQEFLNIKGVGEKKYKQFGEQFNAILTNWIKDHPKEDKAIQINQDNFKKPIEKNEIPSIREIYKHFQKYKQIKDIA